MSPAPPSRALKRLPAALRLAVERACGGRLGSYASRTACIAAESPPRDDQAGGQGALEPIVGLVDSKHGSSGRQMPQPGDDQQWRSCQTLNGAPDRALLDFGIVHGVEHFAPRRAADPVGLASAGTVSDDDVSFQPIAAKRAQTVSGQ